MKTRIRDSYTPKLGDYCNTLVVDKETGNQYLFDADGVWTLISTDEEGIVEEAVAQANAYTDDVAEGKVDKEEGKGLSENDFTDADKDKLDGIEAGAQENVIEVVKRNGATLPIVDKAVDVEVPTATSALTNDSGYITNAVDDLVNYYDKDETDTLIATEAETRDAADLDLQEQIDAISSASDVVDVVGTYAELQNYDTSKLGNNDIIKVLTDETHDDAISYYRWNDTTETFTYIGSQGPFYTKSETDATFVPQTRTINGKGLNSDVVLTAADVNALPASTVIPTVNDATLTIKKNGTTVTTFTANSAQNATADISVPTKVSDLTNDLDFVEESDLAPVALSGAYADLTGKPSIPTKTSDLTNDSDFVSDANYVHTDNNFTTTLKNKLNGIAAGAEVNVQSDWNVTDTSSDAFVKNKPSIPTKTSDLTNDSGFITSAAVPTKTSDLTNDSGFITKNVSDLTNYYTETEVNGMFNALSIPTKTSDLVNDSGFLTTLPIASATTLGGVKIGSGINVAADGTISAAVASLDWANITNKPTNVSYWTNDAGYITSAALPTKTSDLTNDSGFITSAALPTKTSDLTNDSGFITNSVSNLANYYTKSQTYTQGEVNSLLNAIVVPTKTSDLTNDGADGTSTYVEADDLATVATSGSYTDLSDKPTIGNATLTIQKNGTNVQTFTANATSNKTANITVPTKTSDLTNDSNFVSNTDYATANTGGVIKVGGGLEITNGVLSATGGGTADAVEWDNVLNKPTFSTVATSGSYNDLSDKPTIPTVNNATLTIQRNSTNVGTFTANASSNKTINITVPTTAADVSALPASTKYGASITVSLNTTDYKMTTTLKDQDGNTLGTAQTVDLPLESVVVNGSYDNTNKKIVLTLQNGNTVDIPVGDLVAGLQTEITSTNKLSSDLVDDTNHTHKFVTAAQITKLNGIASGAEVNVQSDWSVTDTSSDAFIKNKPTIPTVNNGQLTIQKNGTNVQTFTANQSGNVTANITVPTKTSELTNDSSFVTSSSLDSYLPLSGGILTGNVGINELDNGGTYFHVKDSSQGTALSFGVGSGHVNHGIWSNTLNKWMMYGDATNVYLNGNANTATSAGKLTTARTIAISDGATGTATSFNGTSNISIPITSMKEAYLEWGGKNIAGQVTPVDAAIDPFIGSNKWAFANAASFVYEYSTDGGATWIDCGISDANRRAVTTTPGGYAIRLGNNSTTNYANNKLRLTFNSNAAGGNVYTSLRKILIYLSTNGATETTVTVTSRTIGNYKNNVDTWTTVGTYNVSGWSGWNSIPYNVSFGGSANQTSQIAQIRLTFNQSGGTANMSVSHVHFIGVTNWSVPSELGKTGHLYTWDVDQNATFPASVKVTGSLQHGNYTYTLPNKNGTVAMTSDIPSVPTVNNGQLTIQKNGSNVATFTANQSGNATANITVPTATSDLTNDSGFLTSIPTASASTLGGIKVGNNLTISSDGTLSANASSITVDSALSSTSTNPVQNKVINTALNGKQASLSTAQLNAANSGITAAKVSTYDGYASQIADKQNLLSPGNHIDITSDIISATGYVHSENPQAAAAASSTITGSMIANGTITADKLASDATVKLTMSTSDIGEGAPLAANTLYGVYI